MKDPNDFIWIPFPKNLYNLIVLRSEGGIDPASLAVNTVQNWLDTNRYEPGFWSVEGFNAFQEEEAEVTDVGPSNRGYQWQKLFLPNGTDLRMNYRNENFYAQVRNEKVIADDQSFSPSQWASKVAGNTSRNAWRDIWVKFPTSDRWQLAAHLRRTQAG